MIDSIELISGVASIDYDLGNIRYTDIINCYFKIVGYRFEGEHGSNSGMDMTFIVGNVHCQHGENYCSEMRLEPCAFNSSVDPQGSRLELWTKEDDFDTYFINDENILAYGTKDEGIIFGISITK